MTGAPSGGGKPEARSDGADRRHRSAPAQLSIEPAEPPPGPDPVPVRILWSAPAGSGPTILWLVGDPPRRIATGREGEVELNWIVPGRDFTFQLEHGGEVVAERTVRRAQTTATPVLLVEPDLVPPGVGRVPVRISWDLGRPGQAAVVLQRDPPVTVARGARGEIEIDWLRPGEHTFALVADDEVLASRTVRRERPTAAQWAQSLDTPDAYAAAVEHEQEAWGRILADPDHQTRQHEDMKAAVALGMGRDWLGLSDLLEELGFTPTTCLSVGCGEGRAERALFSKGIRIHFDGIDLADAALDHAREQAQAIGMSARYWAADLNTVELEPERYDLIVAQTSLHHVLRLEHVADEIVRALTPGGLFWLHDYIGESQFQYSSERLSVANGLLGVLPEELTWNTLTQRRRTAITVPSPGTLVSPFESIRSQEIVPVFRERLELVRAHEFDSILRLVCPTGTRAAFNRTPENRALFEALFALDRALVTTGAVPPASGQYLFRRGA